MLLEKTVKLVLRDPPALLAPLVREENKDLVDLLDSRDFLDLRVLLVRVASLESRVCLERPVHQELLDLEATEVSLESVVPQVLLDLLVLVALLDLVEMMVPREMLVPLVLPELRVPPDCRECLVSVVLLDCQD